MLTAAWVLAIASVNPSGNFPINDDWSYADTVRRLVEHGEWRLNPWTSMPLGTQVVWGWLFSQPAGFSFTALRISTLVLAWAATLGIYALLRIASVGPVVALLGAATVAVCPVFFPLAFTFMTDVPALALGVWALVCVLKYIQTRRLEHLAGALGLLVGTTLIRQTGVAVAIGAMAALLVVSTSTRDRLAALACVVFPVVALVVYTRFVHSRGTPSLYNAREAQVFQAATNPRVLISLVLHSAASAYLYVGLFMLPLVPLLTRNIFKRWPAIAALAGLAASGVYVVKYGVRMPALGNVFHDLGLSPVLMARADVWPHAPVSAWMGLTIASAVAAAVVLYQVASHIASVWSAPRRAPAVLFGVACAAYVAPLFAAGFVFDRYLSTPLVLVLALLGSLGALQAPSRMAVGASLVLVAAFAGFDAAATRDLFSFNRARWTAVDEALRMGAGVEDLEGGFEVTGRLLNREIGVQEPRLLISLGDMPGYTRVSSHEFPRLIGTGPGMVYLLQRNSGLR